jgi:DNA-binding transcriptional MerR regulator
MEYQIGIFSKIAKLSIKTLRYYHEIGLLIPSKIDEATGYRYYNDDNFKEAMKIEKLKKLEFSLMDIKEILQKYKNDYELSEFMKRQLESVNNKIEYYNQLKNQLTFAINQNEKNIDIKEDEIIIKEVPSTLIASIRYKGKYKEMSEVIEKLYKNYGKYAISSPFCLYYEKEYKEDNADIEVCVQVSKKIDENGIKTRTLEGGKVVSIIHKGPYDTIGISYKKIIDYLNKNKIKIALPIKEIYLKGKGVIFENNPSEYISEIQIYIK